jgi:hypothetical protein
MGAQLTTLLEEKPHLCATVEQPKRKWLRFGGFTDQNLTTCSGNLLPIIHSPHVRVFSKSNFTSALLIILRVGVMGISAIGTSRSGHLSLPMP